MIRRPPISPLFPHTPLFQSTRPVSAPPHSAVMLLVYSEAIPVFGRMVFSASVSESSSQTIRIRAPSGTFNVAPERVLLSPVISRVRARTLIPHILHSCIPLHGLTRIFYHPSPRQFPSLGNLFGSSDSRSSRALHIA